MITYYNEGNYYGEVYRKYLNARRKANDDWISLFFPLNNSELEDTRKIINNLMIKNIEKMKITLEELNNKISIKNIKEIKISKEVESIKEKEIIKEPKEKEVKEVKEKEVKKKSSKKGSKK